MTCNKGAGEYYIDFGEKSELKPPYYTNQIPMSRNNTGFVGNCTWFINDRLRQLTGFRMESLASAWGNGGDIWQTAQRLGFPVYNAQQALEKRGTLAGYVISFNSGVKSGYGTHIAMVESYNKTNKTAFCSEMWGSQADTCTVHLTPYYESELFNSGMHYIDFSSVGLGDTMTADKVREIYAAHQAERTYNSLDDLPFGRDTIQKLIDKKLLVGDGTGLNISYDMLRAAVILDRAGVYDK